MAEALAVLPPVPVVGVTVGLPESLGDGVGLAGAVLLGVGDTLSLGVGDALAEALGVGVGVQATAGSAVVPFFFSDAATGAFVLVPNGGCHKPGLARPLAAAAACCWPGEVAEPVGAITASCIRFSVNTPTTTTATTAATANAGLSQAAAGPSRAAVLPAGVRPSWSGPVGGWPMPRWLSSQRKDSSRTDSRIR